MQQGVMYGYYVENRIVVKVRSEAGLVMQESGNLVEVDILELSRFPCRGVDIFCTSIILVLLMMKEINLKLTQGMAKRR